MSNVFNILKENLMNKPETGESVPLRQPDTKCFDCGLPYSDRGFQDLIIPDWAWHKISPYKNEGGLLCPNCINRRLVRMGIRCDGAFMSGNIISATECNVGDDEEDIADAAAKEYTLNILLAEFDRVNAALDRACECLEALTSLPKKELRNLFLGASELMINKLNDNSFFVGGDGALKILEGLNVAHENVNSKKRKGK